MAKPAPRPAEGVEFPKDAEGQRPTMGVNKAAFAAAMRAVNADEAKVIDDLPDKKWRRAYQKNVVENVRQSAKSPDAALKVANAGLNYLHTTMVFVRPAGADDSAMPLTQAMDKFTGKKFLTHEIQGAGPKSCTYSVPYKSYGTPGSLKELSGDALLKQIDTWVRNGTIEMSCGSSMSKVAENHAWCDLKDVYVVLFGASSAMGPFFKLMDHGANVIALDLDRPQIWEKLFKETRSRAGKLIFPVKETIAANASDEEIAKVAGCNLLTDTPEIRTWLQDLYPKERLVCMALAYLDGALFVKVSMAMDAIIKSLIEKRGGDKMGCAYLCTPTDAHLCTPASVEAAKSNMRRVPAWQSLMAPLLALIGMPMKKNVEKPLDVDGLAVVDCIIPEQGPNYILAKRLQHWRAMVSREAGCLVSSNVAPSTATASVLSNVLFALGYKGMTAFKPMEISYQETSNSVMAALLIRDIRDPTSAANPKTPLKNPLCLFTENSFHGGMWRGAWKFSSVGAPSLLGYVFFAFLVNPYLLFYSLYQGFGWGKALYSVVSVGRSATLWSQVGPSIAFIQQLGLLEVVHAAAGMTKSSPVMTLVQIFSRILVVALLDECPEQLKGDVFWTPMMLCAWCLADSTRYIYYAFSVLREIATSAKGVAVALKLMKAKSVERADDPVFAIPFPLVWLRYSLFIVLYPTGVSGEMNVIRMAMEGLVVPMASQQPNTFSAWLMQTMRFIFRGWSYWPVLSTIYLAYLFGLPSLFMMLWGARKKQLGRPPAADKKSK